MEHDFFTDLVDKYLDDLEMRKGLGNSEQSPFIEVLRKTVLLDEMSGVVNAQYQKIGGLKKSADEQEKELE